MSATKHHERSELEGALLAELVSLVRAQEAQSTQAFARWRSSITNDVLDVGLFTLDPVWGTATASYPTPFGSLLVVNTSGHTVTVANSPPQTNAPTQGKGTALVPAGTARVVNMAGTTWTVYGTGGDRVAVEAFTKPQPAFASAGFVPGAGAGIATASTPFTVAASVTSVTVIGSNTSRRGLTLQNDSTSVAQINLAGGDAAAVWGFSMQPGERYELAPVARNAITAAWAAAAGQMRVTEFS